MSPPITGTVRTTKGDPLPNARVIIESAPTPTPDIAILTDADGHFTLPTTGPGTYQLTAHTDGHEPTSTTITVTNTPINVELHARPLP